MKEYVEAALVAVILALFAKAFVFEAFAIPSGSMEDGLLVGDHVLVDKLVYAPHRGPWRRLLPYREVARGDVIVFRGGEDPGQDFIKRAVAVAGDTVSIERKRLLVNGLPLKEPYAVHKDPRVLGTDGVPAGLRGRDDFGPFAVPGGTVFALGDNRDDSRDSRFTGPVPLASVKGRALLVYWSYQEPERAFTGRGASLRKALSTAVHFFTRTRWERSFRVIR
ncbi:MAG TPA: signal peptidase I [Thermoanaerobaculia bacterium]|nr:signal peptidase I [Thermoanaerobaculia bacterium]